MRIANCVAPSWVNTAVKIGRGESVNVVVPERIMVNEATLIPIPSPTVAPKASPITAPTPAKSNQAILVPKRKCTQGRQRTN